MQTKETTDQELKNPKTHLLRILISILPQSLVNEKIADLQNQYFEEYFNLLWSLIKISKSCFVCRDKLSSDFYLADQQKFDANSILTFCIEMIQTNSFILSGIIGNKKLTEA